MPPPASELNHLVSNWAKFINSPDEPDVLTQTAIAHYQFEAIHPFLDGNGRMGRLLIPIMLYEKSILSYPLLYVSAYFEQNREEYYAYLRMVDKERSWEPWLKHFLKSIKEQALDTQNKVLNMLDLYKDVKEILSNFNSQYAVHLLDIIFKTPVISFKNIKTKINTNSYQTIYNLLNKFQEDRIREC